MSDILPNIENCEIAETKIVYYLLDLSHPDGSSKARFFIGHGFNRDKWQELAAALKIHAQICPVAGVELSPFGTRYVVEGELNTPDQRNPQIRAVWFINSNDDKPRFVTAYPLKRMESRDD